VPRELAELAQDEIYTQWRPVLSHAHEEPAGWRFDCPVCGAPRGLSVQAKPDKRHPEWNPVYCGCSRGDVRAALAKLGLVTNRYSPRHAIDREELVSIILDRSLPPNALRVVLLQKLGMATPDIRSKLGLSKQSWSDAVRILGRNRRSALVRILGLLRICKLSLFPQVRRHLTGG